MRDQVIKTEQELINKINAMTEFTYPYGAKIPDIVPVLLHRSKNPSVQYMDRIYADVYDIVANGNVLVGVKHLDGTYDVLMY